MFDTALVTWIESEARACAHSTAVVGHLLRAIAKTETVAAAALDGFEPRLDPPDAEPAPTPQLGSELWAVVGFVHALALGRDVTAEDALVGVLWVAPAWLGGARDPIARRLAAAGYVVPVIDEIRAGFASPASSLLADGYSAIGWANRYLQSVRDRPVLSTVAPGEIRAQLPDAPPDDAEPFADVLRDLDELLLPGITHWNHPRFFAYFAISAPPAGVLAELLSAALNVNAMVWSTSPAATELEQTAMDWLAQLLGLPRDWHGHIEDTASTATVAALAAARTLRPGGVVYASEQANFSVEKAARLLGLEYRTVPVDDAYRMRTDFPLDDATAVVATVGTTATTSVDSVGELADRCEQAGVWLHVDAAYAGSAWVCPELRDSQVGVERADSIVVNPHKWLFTPIDCSALWTRRPEAFHAAFSAEPAYLRSTEDALNLKDYGPALGRRFRALKLWAVMRTYGRTGLQALIREHVRLAQEFAGWVEAEPGWEVVAPHPFSTVCFRPTAADTDEVVERANATGELFVAATTLRGQRVIRLAIGNWQTTEADVRRAWEVLRESA
jgi:aromatic-L-amino-acid decarboxylase